VLDASTGATGSTAGAFATVALLSAADLGLAGTAAAGTVGLALAALAGVGVLLVLTGGIFTLGVTDGALAFGAVLEAGFEAALAATVLAGAGFRGLDFFAAAGFGAACGLLGFAVFPGFAFTSWLLAGSSSTGD